MIVFVISAPKLLVGLFARSRKRHCTGSVVSMHHFLSHVPEFGVLVVLSKLTL